VTRAGKDVKKGNVINSMKGMYNVGTAINGKI
jgi:hypothetical protein